MKSGLCYKKQVDVDLVISTEASETETENYADVFVAGKEEAYSDVEPCSPERVTAREQQPEPEMAVESTMVPEILAEFKESIMIEDDEEPGLVMDIPSATGTADASTASAEWPDDATPPVMPAHGQMKELKSTTSMDVDVTARIPVNPA